MAKKTTIDAIIQLYSKLGGNLSDVLGTRSNVNFMGLGKSSEPFLDMDLNLEALGAISKSKALQELKSPVGFATAEKLNDVQANKLLTNMMKMDEFYNPRQVTNITDLATGTRNLDEEGLMTLRRGGDPTQYKPGDPITSENFGATGFAPSVDRKKVLPDEEKSALMSRLDEIVKNKQAKRQMTKDEYDDFIDELGGEERLEAYSDFDGTLASATKILAQDKAYTSEMESLYKAGKLDPVPGEANRERFLQKKFNEMEASGDKKLMTRDEIEELSAFENTPPVKTTPFDEAVEYNARPEDVVQNLVDQKFGVGYFDNVGENTAKRGSAREFLVEALKKENPNQTTFADIVDGADVKAITEGGGGAAGDPIALVDKYFGPRIVEMLPSGASSEEIAIFTERVLTKVRDANGLRPGDPRFDRMTARFVEDFARGGLAKILEV